MTTGITIFGIDLSYLLCGLAAVCALALLLIIILLVKTSRLKKKYRMFMKGENGKSLEKTFVKHFEEMERIEENHKILDEEMGRLKDKLQLSYSKMHILKYNAFKEMGGETSFAIALLDHKNNGIVLNAMSNRYGSYMYAKEIKDGHSEVALSKEEQIVLEDCMNQ